MSPQQSIAHYRIVSKLGEGGMGAVYRATDTKLNRDVAIKVLPDSFAADSDRMARFQREAQVLASLNHPNIAAIYGIEQGAIVMELVEGGDLRGPLPLDTAVAYARQIADALEAAHEKGIVHRDLKPANIKVTPDGVVKVLDFGLAKTSEPSGAGNASMSPTLSLAMTQAGMILGTASYMSPEQAAGKPVDKRADIWSFGVVLWEMLTGRQFFAGETIALTLADVLRAPIDLSALPKTTPPAIRHLIARCLERDVKKRLRDIGEARILLEKPLEAELPSAPRRASFLPWIAAAVVFVTTAALAFFHFREAPPEAPLTVTTILPPDGAEFRFAPSMASAGPIAISPNGRRLVFSAQTDDGRARRLWLRRLDSPTAQPLPGTEDGVQPFWSPDSRYVGFFGGGKLKKIDTTGGPPVPLCDAPIGRGGTWSEAGVILFVPNGSQPGLSRVSSSGGVPAPLNLDVEGRWAWFLPDGRHFLYSAAATLRLGSLDSRKTALLADALSDAQYTQGHVLYLREDTLMAQPFDLKRLAFGGEAVPVAENVLSVGQYRRAIFSVSKNGLLAYSQIGGTGSQQLAWFDRSGKQLGTLGETGDFGALMLSPDGKHLVTSLFEPASRSYDLWLYDIARDLKTRVTFEHSQVSLAGIWSPDGKDIVFAVPDGEKNGVYRKAADLSGAEQLLWGHESVILTGLSPDGKSIAYIRRGVGRDPESGTFIRTLDAGATSIRIAGGGSQTNSMRFSPDGRWIVYSSLESARQEVYVMPWGSPGGKVQISSNGGSQPRWRSDGKEIFYVAQDGRLTAVEVKSSGNSLQVGRVESLWGRLPGTGAIPYDVTPDGQRFLVRMMTGKRSAEPLTLVQNWTALLKK